LEFSGFKFENLNHLLDLLFFERLVRREIKIEEIVYMEVNTKRLAELNIAQLSYSFHSKKIRDGLLPHSSIKMIYRFLELVHCSSINKSTVASLSRKLLSLRKDLWETLQQQNYNYDAVFLTLGRFKKLSPSFPDINVFNELKLLLEGMLESFSSSKIQTHDLLWKSQPITTLVKQELWDVGFKLKEIDDMMDFWKISFYDWFVLAADWSLWVEYKKMVTDAMSTLYFLNDQEETNQELFHIIKQLPEV
jgi:hypothetical protein